MTTNPVDAPLTRIAIEPTASTGIEQPSVIMLDKITMTPRPTYAIGSGGSPTLISFGSTARSSYFSALPTDPDLHPRVCR